MKLELDIQSPQNSSVSYDSVNSNGFDTASEDIKKLLRAGIKFAKDGSRTEARQMLLQVTEIDDNNETAWLWLASISEYPEELLVFLQNVLRINPDNERAIEWAKQTKSLLSKTFVQRGIDASHQNQKDFGKQCFLQAIVHDDQNEMAWLWLASSSDAPEEKCSHLQKVLNINPANETALSSLKAVKNQISQSLLKKANSAAIAGDHEFARQMLADVLKHTPNLEEGWMLKAFLTNDYYEKMACYEKALEINPNHDAAYAGKSALEALAPKTSVPVPEPVVKTEVTETEPEVVSSQLESNEASVEETVAQQFVEEIEPSVENYETDEAVQTLEENQPQAEVENQALEDFYSEPKSFEPNDAPVAELHEENQVEKYAELNAQSEVSNQPAVAEEFNQSETSASESESELTTLEETQLVENAPVAEFEAQPVESLQVEETEEFAENNLFEQAENQVEAVQTETQEFVAESVSQLVEENQAEVQATEDVEKFEEAEPTQANEQVDETQSFQTFIAPQPEFEETHPEATHFEEANLENQPEQSVEPSQPVAQVEELQAPTEFAPETEEVHPETVPVYPASPTAESGFALLSGNEPFADYQQPTVELSYSNLPAYNSPSLGETTADYTEEIKSAAEAVEANQPQAVESAPFNESAEPVEIPAEPLQAEVSTQVFSPSQIQSETAQCAFCKFENPAQAVICDGCQAMISLSDVEMLLAHQNANQDVVLRAIEQIEVEKVLRDLSATELQNVGIAHLNVNNLRKGFSYLREASELNPNDVVLASKVNFLAIRLNEIEEHDQKAQENPVKSRTILVVDDSPTVRKLISGKLEKSGHSVVSAVDGMDALAKINEVIPDLILLDITMPRLDGYQVCKLIRNNEATKDLPVVMISGKDGFFDKVRGRMAGSSGYITKPFGPDTLMKTIETYLA